MRLLLFFWLFIFIKSSFSFVQLYPNYNLTLIRVRRIFREPRAPYPTAPLFAEAYLNNYYNPYIKGLVVFQQTSNGVGIYGIICGLTPGYHGLHIYELGKMSTGCSELGPHFNPTGAPHGSMKTQNRHAGDLGNIVAGPDGVARISMFSGKVSLLPEKNSIMGRSLAIRDMPDDYSTGNSGTAVSCGVIGYRNGPVPSNFFCPY